MATETVVHVAASAMIQQHAVSVGCLIIAYDCIDNVMTDN